jgi:arabinosaccharide transport system permease protein
MDRTLSSVRTQKRIAQTVLLVSFAGISVVTLFPMYYLTLASFRPTQTLFRSGMALGLDLENMTLENYEFLLSGASRYGTWYRNSVVLTAAYTALVGYGLAVYKFVGRSLVFGLVLFVMMIPLEILMLPLFQLIVGMRLINTFAGVIIPYAAFPLGIFFFRQYALTLPRDYLDAGRIDGCTEYGLFLRIMAPLMAPAFGAMTILLARKEWNNFVWPLVVLRTNDRYTLPIGLASQIDPYGTGFQVLLPGAVLAVLPIVVVFILNQKYFISGLTVGGIKG